MVGFYGVLDIIRKNDLQEFTTTQLLKYCDCCERSLNRILSRLVDCGILTKEQTYGGKHTARYVVYKINGLEAKNVIDSLFN